MIYMYSRFLRQNVIIFFFALCVYNMSKQTRSNQYFDTINNKKGNAHTMTVVTTNVDGLTTAIIPHTASYVNVTVGAADEMVSLSALAPQGQVVRIYNATGTNFYLKAGTNAINGVALGGTKKIQVKVGYLLTCTKVAFNHWLITANTVNNLVGSGIGGQEVSIVPA